MSGQEARINDALKQLGEEYRLGMVALDEYRSRRRLILESWGERDVTTSPGSRKSGTTTTQAPLRSPAATSVSPAAKKSNAGLIVAVIAAVLVGGAVAFVMTNKAPTSAKPATAPMPAVAPLPPGVAAIKKSADDFLARNTWEAAPIDAFISQWQALSSDERARALEEPTFKTLRSELQQNLAAETQLVAADAPPEQRQRLDALTRFANALGGT